MKLIQFDPRKGKYYIKYEGKTYRNLILCGHSYGGAVVNRLTNMIKTRYGNIAGIPEFCKKNIQVYTFGTIRKRSFDDRDFFHTYINYMYYNDISALHMVEIQHIALLKQAIENLMFSETLYFDDRVHDIVWILDKLELEIDIKKHHPLSTYELQLEITTRTICVLCLIITTRMVIWI
jgi:hypothetical protein